MSRKIVAALTIVLLVQFLMPPPAGATPNPVVTVLIQLLPCFFLAFFILAAVIPISLVFACAGASCDEGGAEAAAGDPFLMLRAGRWPTAGGDPTWPRCTAVATYYVTDAMTGRRKKLGKIKLPMKRKAWPSAIEKDLDPALASWLEAGNLFEAEVELMNSCEPPDDTILSVEASVGSRAAGTALTVIHETGS